MGRKAMAVRLERNSNKKIGESLNRNSPMVIISADIASGDGDARAEEVVHIAAAGIHTHSRSFASRILAEDIRHTLLASSGGRPDEGISCPFDYRYKGNLCPVHMSEQAGQAIGRRPLLQAKASSCSISYGLEQPGRCTHMPLCRSHIL